MTCPRLLAPAFAAAALLFAPLANAQVLKQVPHDANIVVKINKLKPVSDKLGGLFQKLGIAQFRPDMADPLAAFKRQAKVTNGLDDNGEAAIVLPNTPGPRKGDPAIIVLLPVTDYKAFIGNFQGANTQGEVTTIKFGDNPRDSYVVNWGNYAAIGTTREVIAQKPDGITPQGLAAKELENKDIVTFVNLKAARAHLLPQMTQGRAQILKQIEQGMMMQQPGQRRGAGARGGAGGAGGAAGGANAQQDAAPGAANAQRQQQQQMLPLVRAVVNRAMDVAEQVVRDGDAATYGISITDAGINATGLLEFAAESPSAAQVTQIKNSGGSMLTGLPQTKYLLLGGVAGDPATSGKWISGFFDPILKEAAGLGESGKALQAYVSSLEAYVAATKSSSFGMIAPSGMLGQDAILQQVSVNTGNAPAMTEAMRQMFDSQQAMMSLLTPQNMTNVKTTYTANAKAVEGVQFNQFQTSFAAPPGTKQTPQQMQMQQMMTFMYGPGGVNVLTGQIGNDKMIAASGLPDPLLAQAVAAAKAGEDPLAKSEPIRATEEHLPKQRVAAMYVAVDQIATTAANYAKAFGMPINFQLPENLAPIGITFASEGSAVRTDAHLPAQTLQSVIAGVMQTVMQMQGGQQPGGPGAL